MAEKKKILIIEDDKFLSKMLGRGLETDGFAVALAATGAEGIAKAKSHGPDLVLLDIMLPDVDGFDVLKSIKAEVATKKAPVIIISNLGQSEDINQGKKLGAVDYIVKSDMSLDEVTKKVKQYLK